MNAKLFANDAIETAFLGATPHLPIVLRPTVPIQDLSAWVHHHRDALETCLRRYGGILFRDFGLSSPNDFEAFAEAISPGLYGEYGDLPKKAGGRNTYQSTPYPERQMILYHNESAHLPRWPRRQFFFCELPAVSGGATPIVDCRDMLRRLPPDVVAEFAEKNVMYVRTFTRGLDVPWRSFFDTDDRSVVEARCDAAGVAYEWLAGDGLQTRTVCPAIITHPLTGERAFFNQVQLHHAACLAPDVRADLLEMVSADHMPRFACYGDGSEISDAVMAVVGAAYEQCAVRFAWQAGDMLMLDNMLVAHARDVYTGPRKIVVAMSELIERSAFERSCEALPLHYSTNTP